MDPRELVEQLGTARTLEAMRGLVGGVNSRELRHVTVDEPTFQALVAGLDHRRTRVRWWCVQLLDHLDDERAIAAIATRLDDPVPRVRRNAAHALGCQGCKPSWDGVLPDATLARLRDLADHDPNEKVRRHATWSLACITPGPVPAESSVGS